MKADRNNNPPNVNAYRPTSQNAGGTQEPGYTIASPGRPRVAESKQAPGGSLNERPSNVGRATGVAPSLVTPPVDAEDSIFPMSSNRPNTEAFVGVRRDGGIYLSYSDGSRVDLPHDRYCRFDVAPNDVPALDKALDAAGRAGSTTQQKLSSYNDAEDAQAFLLGFIQANRPVGALTTQPLRPLSAGYPVGRRTTSTDEAASTQWVSSTNPLADYSSLKNLNFPLGAALEHLQIDVSELPLPLWKQTSKSMGPQASTPTPRADDVFRYNVEGGAPGISGSVGRTKGGIEVAVYQSGWERPNNRAIITRYTVSADQLDRLAEKAGCTVGDLPHQLSVLHPDVQQLMTWIESEGFSCEKLVE
jgi:hypothetical protein